MRIVVLGSTDCLIPCGLQGGEQSAQDGGELFTGFGGVELFGEGAAGLDHWSLVSVGWRLRYSRSRLAIRAAVRHSQHGGSPAR